VQQPPGEHAGRIVEREVARDQQEQTGDDETVERDAGGGAVGPGRLYFSLGGRGSTLAPQAQTMLRVAHWMFNSRPHLPQPR